MGFISDADLAALREQVRRGCQELQHPYPAFVLFISFSSGKERAAVRMVRGATYDAVWQAGVAAIRELATRPSDPKGLSNGLRASVIHSRAQAGVQGGATQHPLAQRT